MKTNTKITALFFLFVMIMFTLFDIEKDVYGRECYEEGVKDGVEATLDTVNKMLTAAIAKKDSTRAIIVTDKDTADYFFTLKTIKVR